MLASSQGLTHQSVDDIMLELLLHERKGIELYRRLLKLSEDCSISLEEFAREKIRNKEMHIFGNRKDASPQRRRLGRTPVSKPLSGNRAIGDSPATIALDRKDNFIISARSGGRVRCAECCGKSRY
jgi:hypothetical protein